MGNFFGSGASMTITELPRPGAQGLENAPITFSWDSKSHSMIQDTFDPELKLNTVRETPPGAEETVEQVMSSEWPPFDMHGEWTDKWAGPGFAWGTFLEFGAFVKRGNLCRLVLDEWSFVGIFTGLKPKYRLKTEVGYQVTFSPHICESVRDARQGVVNNIWAKPPDQSKAEANAYLQALANDANDITTFSVDQAQLSNYNDALSSLNQEITRASAAADAAALDDLADPSTLDRVLDFSQQAQRRFYALASAMDRVETAAVAVQQLAAGQYVGAMINADDVGSTLSGEIWARDSFENSVRLGRIASDAAADARSRAAAQPQRIYVSKYGDTLEKVSYQFFGTADGWVDIFQANPNLESAILTPGIQLIIPLQVTR